MRSIFVSLLLAGVTSPLAPQVQTQTFAQPSCATCRWTFHEQADLRAGGDTSIWFGRPAHVTVTSDIVYVTDLIRKQVLRFDRTSGVAIWFGREGRGPGEFELPGLVAPGPDGTSFVVDVAQRRVSRHDASGSFLDGFHLPDGFRLPASMLVVGDRLLIAGYGETQWGIHLLHAFSFQGEQLYSAIDADPDIPIDERNFAGGFIVWDADHETLWFSRKGRVFELLNMTTEGEVLARIQLADGTFADWPPRWQTTQDNGRIVTRVTPTRGTIGLVPLADTLLLNITKSDTLGTVRFDVFDRRTGAFVARRTDTTPIIPQASGGANLVLTRTTIADEPTVSFFRTDETRRRP